MKRKEMENPLGAFFESERQERAIARNRRIFYRVVFIAALAFIAGAVYGWPELLGVGL